MIINDEFKTELKLIDPMTWCYFVGRKEITGKEFNEFTRGRTIHIAHITTYKPGELVKLRVEIYMCDIIRIPSDARIDIMHPKYVITDKFIVSKKC